MICSHDLQATGEIMMIKAQGDRQQAMQHCHLNSVMSCCCYLQAMGEMTMIKAQGDREQAMSEAEWKQLSNLIENDRQERVSDPNPLQCQLAVTDSHSAHRWHCSLIAIILKTRAGQGQMHIELR